jgi:hypothetical protein
MLSKIQKYIVPSFLKRLDFWLLTHKPHIWRTRGHFVVFYGAIVGLLFFLLGLLYPQTLFDLHRDSHNNHSQVVFAFTVMSFLLALGGLFWWWFSIQKYVYKRTSVQHFLIETGIYAFGIFSLWSVFWAFYLGFSYKTANFLEKNKLEDKEWFNQNDFFNFGYMPYKDANKLSDLNQYFANGEKLVAIQKKRESETYDHSRYDEYSVKGDRVQTDLSSIDWEYRTLNSDKIMLPQYTKASDNLNVLFGNDSLRLLERKNRDINDDEYFSDRVITGLGYESIVELSENIYSKYFYRIDYSSISNSLLYEQVPQWVNQKTFIESLDSREWTAYNNYLSYLADYYKDHATTMVSIRLPQLVAFNIYVEHYENRNDTLGIYSNYHASQNHSNIHFGDQDKNAIAAEKFQKLMPLFDLDSRKKYCHWLSEMNGDFSERNIGNSFMKQLLDKTYASIKPNRSDSLILYDYYTLKLQSYDNYRAFFTHAFTDYIVKKYSAQDFDRIHNLLTVNDFPEEVPQYKESKLQKIALLIYSKKYSEVLYSLEQNRTSLKGTRLLVWSGYSILYCLLLALVFYVTTLGTGIQFWVSLFISGIYWALMFFIGEISRWGRNYDNNGTPYNSQRADFPFNFMVMHCVFFSFLILYLIYKKTRIKNAHLIINSVFLSGLGAVVAATYYWIETIKAWYYSNDDDLNYHAMGEHESLRIVANVFIVAIVVYALTAWLFKRHLTYPKKK